MWRTVGEVLPHDLELTEDLLNLGQDLLHNGGAACNLQVVDVFGHDAGKFSVLMATAELGVDLAGNKVALVASDRAQLDAES